MRDPEGRPRPDVRDAVGAGIIAEARGQPLDRILERSWQEVLGNGTRYVGPRELADRVRLLELRTKTAGEAGLELADLVVSPIGRHVIGKPPREDWVIIAELLWRCEGSLARRGPGGGAAVGAEPRRGSRPKEAVGTRYAVPDRRS